MKLPLCKTETSHKIHIKISDFKKHLNDASKDDLVKQVLEIYRKNDFVKNYYRIKYDDEYEATILAKHKEIIEKEFFPNRGFGKARLSVAKKSISEYKKLSRDKEKIADIMLFYVEMGVQFTNSYGDIDEPFYTSMEGMYEKTVKYIVDSKLASKFIERCQSVVKDTNGIGWGFHDQLQETYDRCLSR